MNILDLKAKQKWSQNLALPHQLISKHWVAFKHNDYALNLYFNDSVNNFLFHIYTPYTCFCFSSNPHHLHSIITCFTSKPMALLPYSKCIFLYVIIFLFFTLSSMSQAELDAHYYDKTCPQAEKIISDTVLSASKFDPKVPARILRMFFHDCFIRVREN